MKKVIGTIILGILLVISNTGLARERPNLVFITADDLSASRLGGEGEMCKVSELHQFI